MKLEIPKCERCCFCLPLRRGIVTLAYISLFLTILFGTYQAWQWLFFFKGMKLHDSTIVMYRGLIIKAQMFLGITLYVLDIIFNVLLIVGIHKKNSKLMRWYYYYQLTTMIANFLVMLTTNEYLEAVKQFYMLNGLSEYSIAFIGFVVQIYILLLVHSELKKQRYQEGVSSYVNQMAEVFIEPPNYECRGPKM